MELKYGERKFIGVIKFFDAAKGFGFIASNCCGMPEQTEYKQDFYIDSSSFLEGKSIREGGIVVFQIEQQSRNRVKAVNVRLITKTEDKDLILQYYEDYEYIELKEDTVNVFRHLKNYYAAHDLLELTSQRIAVEDKRTVERTTKLVYSLIGRFDKKTVDSKAKYIFEYDTEHHDQWVNFFNGLTAGEMLEIIKKYPTAVIFTKDEAVIKDWIAGYKDKELELPTLMMLKSSIEHLPKRKGNSIQKIIDKNVGRLAEDLINEQSALTYLNESKIRHSSSEFHQLTGQNYDYLLTKCRDAQKTNLLRVELGKLKSSFSNIGPVSHKAAEYYRDLSDEGKEAILDEVKAAISETIVALSLSGRVWEIFNLLGAFSILGQEFTQPYYDSYQGTAEKAWLTIIEGEKVNDELQIESFRNKYQSYLKGGCSDEVIATAKQQLLSATSLPALYKMYYSYSWTDECIISFLTKEEILNRVKEAINCWTFQELKDYLESEEKVFEKENLDQIVINRAFDLIGKTPLSEPFDADAPQKLTLAEALSGVSAQDTTKVIEENCSFLNALGRLKGDHQTEERWFNYIQSCNYQEKLALYKNGVISSAPQDVAEEIVHNLTVEDFYDGKSSSPTWLNRYDGYTRPKLKEEEKEKMLKSSSGLFEVIEKRVLTIELVPENYYLIIFLLELVRLKLPEYPDYYEKKDWNQQLKNFINRIIFRRSDDPKMKTILWAVFFQSAASLKTLTDIFSDLPPYIQINAVKKLFQLKDQGKLNLNAESMYKLVGGGVRPLCFPLEITFAYLKLRSENPKATLTNNLMLQLLDGREDHRQWEKITHLLHQCPGRIYVEDGDKSQQLRQYHNGMVKESKDRIEVYIPETMCDIDGEPQEYNNKHFNAIKEYAKINFGIEPKNAREGTKAYLLYFNKDQQIEVYNMARVFNLCFRDRYQQPIEYNVSNNDSHQFCEVRQALKLDKNYGVPFYWCRGYPCYRGPVRFMMNSEWERYTILDFMRILNIPVDYESSKGITRFGHYIILSSFMLSFKKFYSHLECRSCKKLMKPNDMSNFATRAVTEFSCANEECENFGKVVYLNHCFNRKDCNATIDSRDSKQCPNGQYICPECGACCSTQNFANRLSNLRFTGGAISPWLENFVNSDLGHWEKNEFYCYKCGKKLVNGECPDCNTSYDKK